MADDLAAILHACVETAFERDVVAPEAVDRIATAVAAEGGDCRQALTLLLRAGQVAEREQASTVTMAHVEAALAGIRRPRSSDWPRAAGSVSTSLHSWCGAPTAAAAPRRTGYALIPSL